MNESEEGRYVEPVEDISVGIEANDCLLVLSGSLYDAILRSPNNSFVPIENKSNHRLNFARSSEGILMHFPLYGSPRIAAAVEQLGAIGVKRIVALGLCGSLREDLGPGSYVVASAAVRTDAVGVHYAPRGYPAYASTQLLADVLSVANIQPVLQVSTDALYRETYSFINQWRKLKVDTIDMESAALYVVARTLGIKAIWTGIVSDLLWENKHTGSVGGIDVIAAAVDAASELISVLKKGAG